MNIEEQTNIEIMLNVVNKIRKKLGIQSVQQLEILLAVMMQEKQQQILIEKHLGLSAAQLSMNLPWLKTNGFLTDHIDPDKSRTVDLTPKTKQFRDILLKMITAGLQSSVQDNNKKSRKNKKLPMGLTWRGNIIYAQFMFKGKRIYASTKTDNIKEAKAILRDLRAEMNQQFKENNTAASIPNHTARSQKVPEKSQKGTSRNQKLPFGLVWRGGTLHTNFLFKGKRIKKNTGTDNIEEAKEFLRRTRMDIKREEEKARMSKHQNQKKSFEISPNDKKIIKTVYNAVWADKVDGANCRRRVEIALEMMDCSLTEVDSMSIDTLIGKMKSQEKKNSTINNYMNCLFVVLRKAQDYGMIQQVPRKPKGLHKPNNTRVLNPEEIQALLEYFRDISGDLQDPGLTPVQKEHLNATHCNHRTAINKYTRDAMRDLILVLLDTGMRLGESLKMEYGRQIDLKEGSIGLSATDVKTQRPRVIKMTDRVLEILKRRSKIPKNKNRAFNISTQRAIQAIQVYRKKMDIEDREFKLHALRHTFASRQIRKGVDLYTLSKLMGHADVSTTQMYAHLVQQNLDDAMAVLEGDSYSKLKE